MAELKTIEFTRRDEHDGLLYGIRVTVSDNYDIATNTSMLTVTKIEAKGESWNGASATVDGTVLINGQTAAVFNDTANWGSLTAAYSFSAAPQSSVPVSVLHNNDGTLSVTVALGKNHATYAAFTIAISAGGYLYRAMQTDGQTLTLTTQPRASSIASCTQNAATQGTIALTMNRKIPNATHVATVTAGGRTLYTSASYATSLSITAARTWFASFPTATSFTATVSVQTYLSGAAIGDPVTASVTVTADEGMKPTGTGWMSYARVQQAAASGIAAYIKGYSSVRFTFDTSKLTMASGATLEGFRVVYNGITKSTAGTSVTTDVLNASGTVSFTVYAIDSRGRYAETSASIIVENYSPPTLSGIRIQRSTAGGIPSDEGTYIALEATANISSIGGLNSYTLKASYKAQGGSYGTETAMTSGVLLVLGGGLIATNQSYTARIRLTDALGNTASFEQLIATAEVAFNIRAGGGGAAFGKYAEADNELQLPAGWGIKVGESYVNLRAANPNLLDNWYFGNPVNQRGQSSYTHTAVENVPYAIDRWYNHGTLTVGDGYVSISSSGSPYGYAYAAQKFEHSLIGKTVTISVLMADGSLYSGTKTVSSTSQRINIGSGGTANIGPDYFNLHIVSGTVNVIAAKVELGSQQTLAHQSGSTWALNEIPDFANELYKCKRFYQVFPRAYFIKAGDNGSSTYYIPVDRPEPEMYAAPSYTDNGMKGIYDDASITLYQGYAATKNSLPYYRTPAGGAAVGYSTITLTAPI